MRVHGTPLHMINRKVYVKLWFVTTFLCLSEHTLEKERKKDEKQKRTSLPNITDLCPP